MSNRELPTPEKVAEAIETAMKRAMALLLPGRHILGHEDELAERERIAASVGVDERVLHIDADGWEGTGYRHAVEHAFHVGVEANIRVGFMRGVGLQVKVEPSWASGPRELDLCLAAAKLHLETVERCAQVQAAMRDAVDRPSLKTSQDAADVFQAGARLYAAKVEAQQETFGNAWRAYREAKEQRGE